MELFSNADIDFKPIVEYVSWFLDKKDIVQLPPIQRNAVWDVQQIERLWDSILRNFPIGSFLFSPRKKGETARSLFSIEQTESETDGYFLLDGQQRTRAILLGFTPNCDSRLWIDLNPQLSFENSEFNDRQFLFRLITTHQPWGMSDRNAKDKLRDYEKYQARTELYGDSIRYDYDVEINNNRNLGNKFSWPIKATMPIPFDSLVNLCGGYTGNFIQPEWEKVLELIPERYKQDSLYEPTAHYPQIIKSLKHLLDNKDNAQAVAFLKQPEYTDSSNNDDNIQVPMEVLFRRINSSGTTLEGEEMAFSLLKSSWDKAYDMVSKIVHDDNIGYLLPPTGIVMAATRMARFNLNKIDDAKPNGSKFRKWIGEKKEDEPISFLEELQNLMQLNLNNGKSEFHQSVERFCELALYRNYDDIGIPRKLLLSIKPVIYHPVLIWLYQNKSNQNDDESNRKNILRYLIYSFIGVNDHNEASKIAIEILRNHKGNFPDFEIYKQCLEAEIALRIPNIDVFNTTLNKEANGLLHNRQEIMGEEDDVYRDFRNSFWGMKELLIWFQREYNSKWFKGYNPMSNDAYDTPYDYDHIMPKSHLITSGKSPETYIEEKEMREKFFDCRSLYVNSIGNYRIWPYWANRSDNNVCHTDKLRMEVEDNEPDNIAKELSFQSNMDFIRASLIDIKDFDIWKNAGGECLDWPEERRIAWQSAVEKRVVYLFKIFYTAFGFDNYNTLETIK